MKIKRLFFLPPFYNYWNSNKLFLIIKFYRIDPFFKNLMGASHQSSYFIINSSSYHFVFNCLLSVCTYKTSKTLHTPTKYLPFCYKGTTLGRECRQKVIFSMHLSDLSPFKVSRSSRLSSLSF